MTSRTSLVHRITLIVSILALIAVTNMLVSLAISTSIEGNATAINLAGSVRLQSYRMLADVEAKARAKNVAEGPAIIRKPFSQSLSSPALLRVLPRDEDHPLNQQYRAIQAYWNDQVAPLLGLDPDGALRAGLAQKVDTLNDQISHMVMLLQERTEARIRLVNLVQMVSLVLSIVMIAILFFDIRRRVIEPLARLVQVAQSVARRDFSQRADLGGADELSQLGQAFDQMTRRLSQSYQKAASENERKTAELERSNAALELLHRTSRKLFASHDLCDGAVPMLKELEQLLGVGPMRLYLYDDSTTRQVQAAVTATRERPFYCRNHHCNACLAAAEDYHAAPGEPPESRRLVLPIRTPEQLMGTLEVWYPVRTGLPEMSRRLLETLGDQLATAIYLERRVNEEQQLSLAEERAVIARELHDSLAQSLTYLKMQVARLRKIGVTGASEALHKEVLDELGSGLSTAYRQLRELLTTFRLQLDTPDLATAVRQTVDEFSQRLGTPVVLHYDLPARLLSPNEEIHILQIIREALANAVKHAQASEVEVHVDFQSPRVHLRIQDNGVGLSGGEPPLQHYGLIIMQDRAKTLRGELNLLERNSGGVEIHLMFIPLGRHLVMENSAAAGHFAPIARKQASS